MRHLEPALEPVRIEDLRPTQLTVGMREVKEKRKEWRHRGDDAGRFLGQHMVPVVVGPGGKNYVIDHHHLALALHKEKVEHVLTSVVADLRHLEKDAFWYVLASQNWMHLYDDRGELRPRKDLPKSVDGLVDDPFRSLAGELRRCGGYAKDNTPFSEFLWADFLRRRISRKDADSDFDVSLKRSLDLAKSKDANYLPGWCGVE